ncbi:choice-of-anchor I family protein [Ruegeria sp. 2205SS24-7]|uniref:choice-of-anchor I family protein n=1 Tax=Ruegeria discodermiae TaxID=3064389 RepID=UPI00274269DD|nr:choice-of-anchor I family protein [Ruegeria sp. 2205SS24-7]MDP5220416.1 choice-of-anchor I family protein [Ruegeria sp. 2205SS24-7]
MNALISEFQPNPAGSDPSTQTIELFGPAGEAFSAWLLSVESDEGGSAGTVDRAFQVNGTFDASGLLTVEVPDLENPSFTYVLVDNFIGSVGDDFDTNDDGVLDVDLSLLGVTEVFDAVGIPDAESDESYVYGAQLGGVDFSFTGAEPERVFRSGSDGDFYAVNVIGDTEVFDTNGNSISVTEFSENPADATNFGEVNASLIVPAAAFTLELLHFADQEANAATIDNIDNLSGVLNALRAEDLGGDGMADNTLTLSSGDAIIPGLFFDASEAVFGSQGIADIQIQNELGVQAIALGNHEFDLGTGLLAGLIDGSAIGDFSALTTGTALDGLDFTGAAFPYLSANLDFSTDPNLAPLETAGGQDTATLSNVVTSSSVSDVNGELIGIVGATVPTIRSISSPGDDLGILPDWASGSPTSEELDALAAILQAEVDQLLSDNPTMDKVVLLSHMQQISIEQELAARLESVDIIVAGGSNTRLFDDNDRIRDGDSDQGQYPQFITNAGGTTTAVVNTDGNYKYVGRLVIDFDADGNIIPTSYDADVSGAYATDDQGVADLNAEGLIDPEIDAITDAIQAQIVATESNVFGVSNVFLNGNRSGTFAADDPDGVRTQETNLGNLTADANLEYAKSFDDTVVISIKNGGGIRANIGEIVVPAGGTEAVRQPNSAVLDENGVEVKPEGGISQNDIATTLAFNNGLTLLDITAQELKDFLEGAVSALPTGVSGGFPQISGLKFSFDETQTAQTYDVDGNILVAGERVVNAGIFDENDDLIAEVVRDGEVVGDDSDTFRVVTLNFLANSGDEVLSNLSNPNRVDLIDLDADGVDDENFTGDAIFAADGSEQDALAEYLDDNFGDADNAFDQADVGPEGDLRIQNLTFTEDTIFEDESEPAPEATGEVVFEQVAIFQGEGEEPGDGDGAAESVAHDGGKLYVTNGAQDRIDIFTIPDEVGAVTDLVETIDLSGLEGYDGVQSVAVRNGVVAVAISVAAVEETVFGQTSMLAQPGFVALFDAESLDLLSTVEVGNLPDQLTFNADGTQLLVAGEGEKNDDSDNDNNPLGTVAVIDTTDPTAPSAEILDFTQFNGLEDLARDAGIRIQDGVSFAEDVEPEYIAISPDGSTAFVSLQENNAIAKIDLVSNEVVDIFSLGRVDFSSESALDADDNGKINITNFDNLVGFRMADAITSFEVNGQTFIATANEGDSRDFDEDRVGDLAEAGLIDPSVDITGLERLEVSTIDGDTDGDGDIDVLHTFSSRSFSIFDADGNLVFDSGSQFEQIIADLAPERFNDDDGDDGEDRSDAKGPEPEAIAVGEVGGRLYAFIGLERDSGIMIYDISEPENAFFVNYIPPLHVDNAAEGEPALHSPEVIAFISEDESGTGNAQIAVSYEVSGTTAVYDLTSINPIVTIMDIQGEGHISEFEGRTVTTTGIVTAVDTNGYYLQDAEGDGNDATSDGIFIFTGAAPTVAVGDEVTVSGDVSEFIPGGAGTGNLSITQISANTEEVLSSGNTVEALVLGANGRPIPTEVVISEDETPVNLQDDPGTFNPETDGIDFYESLEGMLVTVDNPLAISATNRFGESWVVADDGVNTTPGLNDRGGLNLNANADGLGDLNPERIQIQYDSGLLPEGFTGPDLNVGDDLSNVTGVVGYGFGNFEINVTEAFTVEEATSNTAEVTEIAGSDSELTVATYNVLNVTSNEADGDADQIALLAQQIVNNLGSPDILALQEIQDNSGVTDDGTLDADETLQAIVDAIAEAGGPVYSFQSAVVDEDGENGGVPGGNIRNAFLYNEERVEANSFLTLESNVLTDMGVTNPDAFEGSRDPLLGVFTFNDQEITLINNHFSSRFGSEPVFGGPQPFNQGGEDEREAQALAINEVVDGLLANDPEANIAVLGDLNTFDFTDELTEDLPGVGDEMVLTNLIGQLEGDEAYTFNFQGNSQALDHIFVTDSLLEGTNVDFVHVNVDFADAASDHEPIVASFALEAPEEVEGQFLIGTRRRDELTGDDGDDIILGFKGRDTLLGKGGDDIIFGGRGRDEIDGGDGDDILSGGRGRDIIAGGAGNDVIDGGRGRDTLLGGEGDDTFINAQRGNSFEFVDDFGADEIFGDGIGLDQLVFKNVDDNDISVQNVDGDLVITVDGAETFGVVTIFHTEENSLLFI